MLSVRSACPNTAISANFNILAPFLDNQDCPMRKLFVIALFSIHLFGNTDFNQVLQVPYLLAHYLHHVHNDNSISFTDFVAEHYGKGDKDPSDDREEKEMPFMQFHQHAFTMASWPVDEPMPETPVYTAVQQKADKLITVKLPVGFFCAVLKPPRTVA